MKYDKHEEELFRRWWIAEGDRLFNEFVEKQGDDDAVHQEEV